MKHIIIAISLALPLSVSAQAADRAAAELDLRPLGATPLECMHVTLSQRPDITAFCSTTLQQIASARFEAPVPAWVVKADQRGAVLALVLASNLTAADQRAIGAAFEAATRCVWEPDRRVVRVGDNYAALYLHTLAGTLQSVVAVMTPFAAREEFGDGSEAVGACTPAI